MHSCFTTSWRVVSLLGHYDVNSCKYTIAQSTNGDVHKWLGVWELAALPVSVISISCLVALPCSHLQRNQPYLDPPTSSKQGSSTWMC